MFSRPHCVYWINSMHLKSMLWRGHWKWSWWSRRSLIQHLPTSWALLGIQSTACHWTLLEYLMHWELCLSYAAVVKRGLSKDWLFHQVLVCVVTLRLLGTIMYEFWLASCMFCSYYREYVTWKWELDCVSLKCMDRPVTGPDKNIMHLFTYIITCHATYLALYCSTNYSRFFLKCQVSSQF